MSGKLGEKAGAGCLVLFGMPFLLGGLFAGWHAIQEFQSEIYRYKPGDRVNLMVLRNNRKIELPITLEEAPRQ